MDIDSEALLHVASPFRFSFIVPHSPSVCKRKSFCGKILLAIDFFGIRGIIKADMNERGYTPLYLYEMHCHALPCSACGGIQPEDLVRGMKEAGYTAVRRAGRRGYLVVRPDSEHIEAARRILEREGE